MPRIITLPEAEDDLARLEDFLTEKNQDVAKRMRDIILTSVGRLERSPHLGSPFGRFKRLIIKFGRSTYIVVYMFDEDLDEVHVISMRHGLEDPNHPEHGQSADTAILQDS